MQPAALAPEQLLDDGLGDQRVAEPQPVVAGLVDDTPRSTRPRRCRSSSRSSSPVIAVSTSNPAGWPNTASTSMIARSSGVRSASCWRTASSSDHGSWALTMSSLHASGPAQRISSSTTNGTPPLRRYTASTAADDTCRPTDRRHQRADLVAVEPVEAELLDLVAALEAEDEIAARRATAEVGRAVGGEDDEVRPAAGGRSRR